LIIGLLNKDNARSFYKLTYIKTKNLNTKIKRKLSRFLDADDGTKDKWRGI